MYIREEKFRVRSTKDDYSKIIDSMKKYYFYLGAGRK
jgi:hypothetical protein